MQIDRYASPDTLAECSNAPLIVCQLIFLVTEGDRAHLSLLRGDELGQETVRERHAISWVSRTYTHSSFTQIGRGLGCDHSAVVRGHNRAKLLRIIDEDFRQFSDKLAVSAGLASKASGPKRPVQRHPVPA